MDGFFRFPFLWLISTLLPGVACLPMWWCWATLGGGSYYCRRVESKEDAWQMTFQRRKFAVFCLKKSFCHGISKSHSKFCFLEMKLYPTIVVPNKSEIWWVSETGALFLTVLRGKENIDQGCGGWKHVHIATNKGSWIILETNLGMLAISIRIGYLCDLGSSQGSDSRLP